MCFEAKLYLEKDKCNAWVINLFLNNKFSKNVPTSRVLTSILANRKWNQTTVTILDCTQCLESTCAKLKTMTGAKVWKQQTTLKRQDRNLLFYKNKQSKPQKHTKQRNYMYCGKHIFGSQGLRFGSPFPPPLANLEYILRIHALIFHWLRLPVHVSNQKMFYTEHMLSTKCKQRCHFPFWFQWKHLSRLPKLWNFSLGWQ